MYRTFSNGTAIILPKYVIWKALMLDGHDLSLRMTFAATFTIFYKVINTSNIAMDLKQVTNCKNSKHPFFM